MIIRLATAGDAAAMAALESGHPTAAGWGKAGFETEFNQPGAVIFVADEGGRVCGFICGRMLPPEIQVLNMAVSEGCLRKGLATRLLNELFKRGRAAGCAVATLEVRKSNEPAQCCYLKAGFKIVGIRPKFYNGTEDAVLMDAPLI
ncbi:MAG TPA: ribosomal protein S18-alanine N-acetyltransferase [Elusimicrobiales bacterium]|nr:ribosomal protein S18-alanine N-acetyltransferase [Elusimicrobiales bacterium]